MAELAHYRTNAASPAATPRVSGGYSPGPGSFAQLTGRDSLAFMTDLARPVPVVYRQSPGLDEILSIHPTEGYILITGACSLLVTLSVEWQRDTDEAPLDTYVSAAHYAEFTFYNPEPAGSARFGPFTRDACQISFGDEFLTFGGTASRVATFPDTGGYFDWRLRQGWQLGNALVYWDFSFVLLDLATEREWPLDFVPVG